MKNSLRLYTCLMLSWYSCLRWFTGSTNFTSKEWLENPIGNSIAIITIFYLLCVLVMLSPRLHSKLKEHIEQSNLVSQIFTTILLYIALSFKKITNPVIFCVINTVLFIINTVFLFQMFMILWNYPTLLNFGYFCLDFAILNYYYVMMRFFFALNNNRFLSSHGINIKCYS